MHEEAARAKAKELAIRAEFERQVEMSANIVSDKLKADEMQRAKEEKEAKRLERETREAMQRSIAELERQRQEEAQATAQAAAKVEAEWKAIQDEKDNAERQKKETLELNNAQRFPWRRSRHDMEAGYTRRPVPRLSQGFREVAKEWDVPAGNSLPGKIRLSFQSQQVIKEMPERHKEVALRLANSDFLQNISVWSSMSGTLILEEDHVKVSGRRHHEDEHEELAVHMSPECAAEWEAELNMLSKNQITGVNTIDTPSEVSPRSVATALKSASEHHDNDMSGIEAYAAGNNMGDDNEIAGSAQMYAQKVSYTSTSAQQGSAFPGAVTAITRTEDGAPNAMGGARESDRGDGSQQGDADDAGSKSEGTRPPTAGSFMHSRPSTRTGDRGDARPPTQGIEGGEEIIRRPSTRGAASGVLAAHSFSNSFRGRSTPGGSRPSSRGGVAGLRVPSAEGKTAESRGSTSISRPTSKGDARPSTPGA